jgi:hypothetical protein
MRVLSLNLLLLAGIGAPPSLNLSLMLFRADILLVIRVIILQQAQTLFATGTINFLLRNVSVLIACCCSFSGPLRCLNTFNFYLAAFGFILLCFLAL